MPDSIRNEACVAAYWDFENIHAALVDETDGEGAYRRSRYRAQDPLVEITPVVEYMASLGNIVIHRAYANWQWLWKYRDELLQHSIDLIQLFPRGQHAKNGADIRLVLDAIEDVGRYEHITHVVVIGGDSDYIALSQKLRHAGKHVIGIGPQGSTNSYWLPRV